MVKKGDYKQYKKWMRKNKALNNNTKALQNSLKNEANNS